MKETWGFAWFALSLCIIVIVPTILGLPEAAFPAFFSFLPVVFFLIALRIKSLSERIAHLENALKNAGATPGIE